MGYVRSVCVSGYVFERWVVCAQVGSEWVTLGVCA